MNSVRNQVRALRNVLRRRLAFSRREEAQLVEDFHELYYEAAAHQTWQSTFYMGHKILKCPLDLWHYQEIFYAVRPDLIIETGTCFGGSALYIAHLCDLLGAGRVITIDVEHRDGRPMHPRIEYWTGSSTATAIVERASAAAAQAGTVLIILDSDHSEAHVWKELQAFAGLVTVGSFLIVEDTNVNGHPVAPEFGPGPMEAVDRFLAGRQDFEVDARWEKFLLTFNPRGFLRRLS
jgi:cephalosporin hydroxylase